MKPVSELAGMYLSLEEFLHDSFWEIGARSLEEKEVYYNCDCSRERMLEALLRFRRRTVANWLRKMRLRCAVSSAEKNMS